METKRCSKCKEYKTLDLFYNDRSNRTGLSCRCNDCDKLSIKNYSRTKKGLVSLIYNDQVHHSKSRKDVLPSYKNEQLREWVFTQPNFESLYADWVNSGYERDKRPSIDRLDDYKPYTFKNIRLTTWAVNRNRVYGDQINGINTKQCKAVLQYDLDGNFIKEYYSISQAGRETLCDFRKISCVCNGKQKQTAGFIFKFKN